MRTTIVTIRLLLGVVFIAYGSVKLLGGQFVFEDFVLDSRTVDGPTLVWHFFGYSQLYGRWFIGLGEMAAGVLLLLPRTRTIGALILFPIALNITVMDFAFGFPPVKYVALLFTVLCAVLLWDDRRKLAFLLRSEYEVRTACDAIKQSRGRVSDDPVRFSWRSRAMVCMIVLPITLFLAHLVAMEVTEGPAEAAMSHLAAQGHSIERMRMNSWSATGTIRRDAVVRLTIDGEPDREVTLTRPHGFVGWRVIDERIASE